MPQLRAGTFAKLLSLLLCLLVVQAKSAETQDDSPPVSSSIAGEAREKKDGQGDTFESRSIGHLVTPNNSVLRKNEMAVGTLYVGYGMTDQLSVGVSPFVIRNFKIGNVMSRWATDLSARERIGVDLAYFKSYGATSEVDQWYSDMCAQNMFPDCTPHDQHPYGFNSFKMEAWDAKFTYTRRVFAPYRASVSLGYYHYIDDERPFSLRMDPQNDDRYAVTLTSLHEFRLGRNFFVNVEGGFWGLNYLYPYYHLGGTLNFQFKRLLVGLGASTTFNPTFPMERAKHFAGYDSKSSIHPEFQIEMFF